MKLITMLLAFTLATSSFALNKGDSAPSITVTEYAVDGNHFPTDLSDSEGKEYVLVEFFAFWCYYCNKSLPTVEDYARNYADKMTVKMVTVEQWDATVEANMEAWKMAEPSIHITADTDENYPSIFAYGVEGFPTFFLLDMNGNVVHKHVGLLTEANSTALKAILEN